MNFKKKLLAASVVAVSTMMICSPVWAAKKMKLTSKKTTKAIYLDAMDEEGVWAKAKAVKVKLTDTPYKPNNGYEGMKSTTMTIKSLYDKNNIYFMIKYKDPTMSLARFPWVKQADGSWKQMVKKDSTGHDNTYYEDKIGMYWNINARGFAKKGCGVTCHMTENGMNNGFKDKSAGRKYTNKMGETVDMWHWKGVRMGPLGMMDDQYVDHIADPKKNKNWGRHGDSKTGGGYVNNVNKAKTAPMYMNSPNIEKHKYYILPSLKTKFVDTFKTGDIVGGITITPFTGQRGDIKTVGRWADGYWTLEVQRALVTTGKNVETQDVQFKDLKKKYYFGVSVFDNSQINHIFHDGSIELRFK